MRKIHDESNGEYDLTYWSDEDVDVTPLPLVQPAALSIEASWVDITCGLLAVVVLPIVGWLWLCVALGLALQ